MLENGFYLPIVQVRSNSLIIYNEYVGPKGCRKNNFDYSENLKIERKKAYSGTLTAAAKKRMTKAITLLCQMTPTRKIYNPVIKKYHHHKLSFITLTISLTSENVTASECYKKCLRPFLQWASRYKGMKSYVWKAELQKRGQIHYHIATPAFIEYQRIRDKWNYLQKKAGYLNDYYKKFQNFNPNSTDVHSMKKIRDCAAYLTKYFSKEEVRKNDENQTQPDNLSKTVGKVWDCSLNLKVAGYFATEVSQQLREMWQKAIAAKKAYVLTKERFSIIYSMTGSILELLSLSTLFQFQQHLTSIKNFTVCNSS